MDQILPNIRDFFEWRNIVDIAVVAIFLYKLLMLIKGTRAVQLLKGVAVLLVVTYLVQILDLHTANWILDQVLKMLLVAIPVVFQPELRRALEQIGSGKFLAKTNKSLTQKVRSQVIGEVVRCTQVMAKNRIGALIVFERLIGIQEWVETGIKVDGVVSSEFLINIFVPKAPLHDGAVIVSGDRVAAAGCFLPLTENSSISSELGTRHRAAIGISEVSDALALVISEETGSVSIASNGSLFRGLDEEGLSNVLERELQPKQGVNSPLFRRL